MRALTFCMILLLSKAVWAQPAHFGYDQINLEMRYSAVLDILRRSGVEWGELRGDRSFSIGIPDIWADSDFETRPCPGPRDCVRTFIQFSEPPISETSRNTWVSGMTIRVVYVDSRKPTLREVYDAARARYGDAPDRPWMTEETKLSGEFTIGVIRGPEFSTLQIVMTRVNRITESAWLQISMNTRDLPEGNSFGPGDLDKLPFNAPVPGIMLTLMRSDYGGGFHPPPRVRF